MPVALMTSERSQRASIALLAAILVFPPGLGLAQSPSFKVLTVFQGRKISTALPAGWSYDTSRDPRTGVQTIAIGDPTGEIELSLSFFPDSQNRLASQQALEAEIRRDTDFYLEGAVEKAASITFFRSTDRLGGYAVFTDRSLVGRKVPPSQRLYSTVGIRSWDGAFLLFTLLSNSRDSASYAQALELVRVGVSEARDSARVPAQP